MTKKENVRRPFEEAREFARSLVLKGKNEWYEYVKSGQKPGDIPYDPHKAYKDKWVSWPDWVGTVGTSLRPFEEARAFAQTLELDRFRACRWAEV